MNKTILIVIGLAAAVLGAELIIFYQPKHDTSDNAGYRLHYYYLHRKSLGGDKVIIPKIRVFLDNKNAMVRQEAIQYLS